MAKKNKKISEKEILTFIDEFRGFGEDVETCFTCGCCYWFAEILKKRFNAEIYYVPIENHFITKIEGQYYDICGKWEQQEELRESTPYRWRDYQRIEPIESKRIIRDCILKQ